MGYSSRFVSWQKQMELKGGHGKEKQFVCRTKHSEHNHRYIAFCEHLGSSAPTDVLLLDKSFTVMSGAGSFFGKYHHHHIRLMNRFRRVEIKAPSKRHVEDWMNHIKRIQTESPWVQNHRFGSFAPIRNKARVKWFVDGQGERKA